MAGFAISKGITGPVEAPSVDAWEAIKLNHAEKELEA